MTISTNSWFARLPETRANHEFVQFEGDQQRGRDHGQVLGPKLVKPEPNPFDQFQSAVAERGKADDPQLVCAQAMQARDESMEEVLARIDIDAANDSLGHPAEVGGEMEQQIGAGGEQKHAAQRALDRDQAKDEAGARRIAGSHRESLSTTLVASTARAGPDVQVVSASPS